MLINSLMTQGLWCFFVCGVKVLHNWLQMESSKISVDTIPEYVPRVQISMRVPPRDGEVVTEP